MLSFHFFYGKGFQIYSFHQGGYEAAFSFAVLRGSYVSGVIKILRIWVGYSLLHSLRRLRRIADLSSLDEMVILISLIFYQYVRIALETVVRSYPDILGK